MNCNGIQPMESSPLAKGWMLGRPHSLVLSKQQVLEQGVNSSDPSIYMEKEIGSMRNECIYRAVTGYDGI